MFKMAIVGTAHMHANEIALYIHEHPEAELVGVADLTPAEPENTQARYTRAWNLKNIADTYGAPVFADYREMLDQLKPDLSFILCENDRKKEAALACAERGLNFCLEKPMAMPLEELIAADPEGQAFVDDFIDGFMLDSYVDGQTYSIPFQRSTMVMFYNKDAFKEVGLDPEAPPANWTEMVEYAQKLTNDKRYGVGIALNSGSAQWAFTGFSLENCTNGVGLMNPNGKEVYFNTPENIEALQLWLDLQNKYNCMAPGIVQWTDLPTQFLAGEVAMIYHTTGNLTNIKNNATFDFGVCFMPAGRQYGAPTGGGNFYITNGISEERQQAAWKYIKFMCETERAAQWSIDTGYVATRNSCYETELLKDYYASFPQALVAYEQLQYAQPELTTYSAAEMWRILNDNIQAAVTGEMTAAEAMEAAQEQGDELLADYQ